MASTLFGRPPYAYDSERLIIEVANSVYAVRNHISLAGLRQLWVGLANFINVSLKSHKGVLLPALGTFIVGQALEDRFATYKRWRPTFSLLDGRFGGVSQERSRYRLLNRAAVAQLNYQLISQDANIHRSIAQRLLTEMLQRLAMHIVAGHAVQVTFPGVGELLRNKAGRIEFVFEQQLVEALELGLAPTMSPWRSYDAPGPRLGVAGVPRSPGADPLPSINASIAGLQLQQQQQPQPQQQAQPQQQQQPLGQQPQAAAPAGQQSVPLQQSPNRVFSAGAQHSVQRYAECLQTLMGLCTQLDRSNTGAVPRAQLEAWLQAHCRPLLAAVDGATMLDLLLQHTYGVSGRFVHYLNFLHDLEHLVMQDAQGRLAGLSPEAQEAAAAAAYASAAGPGSPGQNIQQPAAWPRQQQQQQRGAAQPAVPAAINAAASRAPRLPLSLPAEDYAAPPDARQAGLGDVAAAGGYYSELDQDVGRDAGGRPVSPVPLNHYLQNMISPRSRAEYDEFNRYHFSQLKQLGRMDKRQVTPKVGEDPLNIQEVAELHSELRSPVFAAEVASRARSPQVTCPRGKMDHVTNILTLERPGEVVPLDPLVPVEFPEQDAPLLDNKPMRSPGASYNFGNRDHIYAQGLL